MLLSYVSKKNKSVLLLATSCNNTNISKEFHKKPELINLYNKTKGGVDTVDRILASTSVKRYTRRWPTVVFYNMVDISLINAFYLYKVIFNQQKVTKTKFLERLAELLVKPFIENKSITPTPVQEISVFF